MTKCMALEDACISHFNEEDPLNLLFEKPTEK